MAVCLENRCLCVDFVASLAGSGKVFAEIAAHGGSRSACVTAWNGVEANTCKILHVSGFYYPPPPFP